MTDSVTALIAEGKQQQAQEQLEAACRLYRQALDEDAGNAEASHMLGLVHFQQGELEQAEALIRTAIESESQGNGVSNSSRLHCNLGAVLMAAQRYPEAHASFESALRQDSADADARYNLGLAAQALGHHQEAIDHYLQVIAEQPDSIDVQLNLGTAYRDAGQLDASESVYTELLANTPTFLPAHYNLGLTLKRSAQWQLAAIAFRRCLELDATFSDGLYALATTLIESGDVAAAAKEYARFQETLPNLPRLHFTFGTVLMDLGDQAGAVQALESALAEDPHNSETRYALGLAELRRGNAAEALAAFEHNLQSRPSASRELAYKVTALAMLGRSESVAALTDSEKLIAVYNPDEPPDARENTGIIETLATYISGHPALHPSPPGSNIDNGYLLSELLDSGEQEPVATLIRILESSIDGYLQTHPRETQHPTLILRPARKRLHAWGQVLSGGARQPPHFHPQAWLSGIFYLQVPAGIHKQDTDHAGWLEIGGTHPDFTTKTPPASRWLCPENGLLIVFPSWFYQQSLPMPGEDPCISVAFHVIPEDD